MAKKVKTPSGFRKTVRLFSQEWCIIYVDEPLSTTGDLGSSTGHLRKITLNVQQSRESMIDTLIHEIAHSYLRMMPGTSEGWEFTDPERTEEAVIVLVTSLTVDLIRANRWIVDLVTT